MRPIPMSVIRRIAGYNLPYNVPVEFRGYDTEAIEVIEDKIEQASNKETVELITSLTERLKKQPLNPDSYQALSRRTQSTELSLEDKRRHALFGLCSEVGEIHSIFQHEYQGKPASKEKVIDECGDLLWFLSELCDTFFINLSDVMEYNINKLQKRFPQGFDVERSERRHEHENETI